MHSLWRIAYGHSVDIRGSAGTDAITLVINAINIHLCDDFVPDLE